MLNGNKLKTSILGLFTLYSITAMVSAFGFGTKANATEALIQDAPPFTSGNKGGNLGIGVMIGQPMGLTGKLYTSRNWATDAGIGYAFGNYAEAFVTRQMHGSISENVKAYVGLGPVLLFDTTSNAVRTANNDAGLFEGKTTRVGVGARLPLGVEWMAPSKPFSIFGEVAPELSLIPSFFGIMQGEAGVRLYI